MKHNIQTKLITIDGKKSLKTALAAGLGLPEYAYIIKTFQDVDVSSDVGFQRHFNHFYKVRRNQEWRENFYKIFEESKNKSVTFESLLYRISGCTDGRIEASFASKMLATLNPDMPIWDSRALSVLGLELKGKSVSEKTENAIEVYNQMILWYQDYLLTDESHSNIQMFDSFLPDYAWINDVKKIDYMIWASAI